MLLQLKTSLLCPLGKSSGGTFNSKTLALNPNTGQIYPGSSPVDTPIVTYKHGPRTCTYPSVDQAQGKSKFHWTEEANVKGASSIAVKLSSTGMDRNEDSQGEALDHSTKNSKS